MVVLDVKELKEPFTVLRPEEFLEKNRQFSLFFRTTDSFTFFFSAGSSIALIQDCTRVH